MADVYGKIVATVKKNLDEQLEALEAQRKAAMGDVPADDVVIQRERGLALGAVFRNLNASAGRMGQVMLQTLWEMHTDHHFELVYECDDARDFVKTNRDQYEDYDYAHALAQVVDLTLAYIERRKTAGDPIMDPETSTEITVEMLIGTEGLVSKLKEQAIFIENLEKIADKETIIVMIAQGKSRTKIDAARAKIEKSDTNPDFVINATETIDPKTNNTKVAMLLDQAKMDYLLRTVLIASVSKEGEVYNVEFDLNEAGLNRLRKSLGRSLELHQVAPKKDEEDEKSAEESVQESA